MYLLETTAFSGLMRRDDRIRAHVASLAPTEQVAICTITRGEILYGLARLPAGQRRTDLEAEAEHLFGCFACVPIPEEAADQYAHIKLETSRKGAPLDENDLWIAASAITVNAVLVTSDSDFERVSGLAAQDWAK